MSGLQVELGGIGKATTYEAQTELVLGFLWRGFDHEVDDFDELGDEEGEDDGVDDVEEGVKNGDGKRHDGDGEQQVVERSGAA